MKQILWRVRKLSTFLLGVRSVVGMWYKYIKVALLRQPTYVSLTPSKQVRLLRIIHFLARLVFNLQTQKDHF